MLDDIADQMAKILGRFRHNKDGVWIADGDQARFTGLFLEAKHLLDEGLGAANSFSMQLAFQQAEGVANFAGTQSYHSVEQAIEVVRSGARMLRRKAAAPPPSMLPTAAVAQYVSLARIEALRKLRAHDLDLGRLVRMCEELNSVFAAGNYLATSMLVRAIEDHVPPIFNAADFGAVVASMPGRSVKDSLDHLHRSLRKIADTWLHQQMRRREALPTETQVDFRQDLDVLLGEIVRTIEESTGRP
jgi:hypothetical protein